MSTTPDPPSLMDAPDDGRRLWVSGWYRIRPRTFEHFELFFEDATLSMVYAEQSYKSFLLRRDGRRERAEDVGREHLDVPTADLCHHERSIRIPMESVTGFRVKAGSLARKPKFVVETDDRDYEFYHPSRTYDVEDLVDALGVLYPERPVVEK